VAEFLEIWQKKSDCREKGEQNEAYEITPNKRQNGLGNISEGCALRGDTQHDKEP